MKRKNKKQIQFEMENDLVLDVRNLSKTYTTNEIKVDALKNVNLHIKKGEFIAIVGPSGSGKTTLINCLGALDFPNSGQIIYNLHGDGKGYDIVQVKAIDQKNMRLNKIGLIFQFYNLFPVITAFENVELPMLIAKKNLKIRKERVEKLLYMVGLGQRMEHYPTQMSGGEQQRVTIARSLVNDPLILLADEPTGELDTETTIEIIKIFLEIKKSGHSIIMVTHNQRIAEVADRILSLVDGEIIMEKPGGKNVADIYNEEN